MKAKLLSTRIRERIGHCNTCKGGWISVLPTPASGTSLPLREASSLNAVVGTGEKNMKEQNVFTRRDEWALSIWLSALIRDATEPLLWLTDHGEEDNRQRNVMFGLEKLENTIAVFKQARKKSFYRKRRSSNAAGQTPAAKKGERL